MNLQNVIDELNVVYKCFKDYEIKCDNLIKMFDKKHPSFFRELNVLFKQTQNNYNYFKNNEFYLYFVNELNSIFDMFSSNPNDKNIIYSLTKLSYETKKYLLDIKKIIEELNKINIKIQNLKINTF